MKQDVAWQAPLYSWKFESHTVLAVSSVTLAARWLTHGFSFCCRPLFLLPVIVPLLLYYAVKLSVTAWTIISIFAAACFLPAGSEWKAFRQSKVWDTWHR